MLIHNSGIVVSFFTGGAFCGAGMAGPVSILTINEACMRVGEANDTLRLEIDLDEDGQVSILVSVREKEQRKTGVNPLVR